MYFFISSTSQSAEELNMKYTICEQNCKKEIRDGKLQCKCGEDISVFNWTWAKINGSSNIRITNSNRDILFHPLYSSGTAVVRGDTPFLQNMHYYWEIKMTSNLYGTDVMVGVGTSKVTLSDWSLSFCSMLGMDSQSWGYSYHGNIQHKQLARKYGTRFGMGSIVGAHLNMCNGTLEFYVNRIPMGIAFRKLKGRELYPMACSTAAQSAMRITCAVSEPPTLQMHCLEFISKYPELYRRYKEIPGLVRLYEKKYFWIVPSDEEDEQLRLLKSEEMYPMNYKNILKRSKKLRAIHWIPPEYLHVREEESNHSDSDVNDTSDDDASNLTPPVEDASTCSACSASRGGHVASSAPSTSRENCAGARNKIRRTGSLENHLNCTGEFCLKCKFRNQLEEEDGDMSDSSSS